MSPNILTIIKKNFSEYDRFLFKDQRDAILSKTICREIEKLENIKKRKVIKILDYGSGRKPTVIKEIIRQLTDKYKNTKFLVHCLDFYTKNELKNMNKNSNIRFQHIKELSNIKSDKFNFCLIIDVLHHIGVKNNKKIFEITKKLKKKSKYLIIKDHFQYGFFSNLALIMMDFIGNYGDNVKIPKMYFSINTFENLVKKLNLNEIKRISNKKYYKWYLFYFNSEKLQFLSVLK